MARNRQGTTRRENEKPARTEEAPHPEATGAKAGEKPKTWMEKHGGSLLILATFGLLVLMVVVKNL